MKDEAKTKKQLINELAEMHKYIAELEKSETERKRAEEALRESEQKFKSMTDTSPLAIYMSSGIEQKAEYINSAFIKLFGYTLENVPTVSQWWPLAYSDEKYRNQIAQEWQRKVEQAIRTNSEIEPMEVIVTCKDGSKKNISWDFISTGIQNWAFGLDLTDRKRAEEALRESERRLTEAQKMAHLGFWYWDVKTGDVEWSEEVFNIFRLDPKEFTPHIDSILALSPWPEDHQRNQELINRAIETHEQGFYEQKFLRPDQSIGYYYSTFQGYYDESGDLLSIFVTVLDITERRQAEEALRQSEEKFSTIFRLSPINISLSTLADGRYVEANDLWFRTSEYTREEVIGHTSAELNIWVNLEDRKKLVKTIMEGGLIREQEYLFRSKSGKIYSLLFTADVIEISGIPHVLSLALDITARKRIEEERKQADKVLLDSQAKYRALVETTNTGFVIIDKEGKVIDANPEYVSLSGHRNLNEIIGRSVIEWTADYEKDKNAAAISMCLQARHIRNLEIDYVDSKGSITPIEINATFMESEGVAQILTLCRDITDRKRVEEEKRSLEERLQRAEKMEALGTLAGGVAHDLNNVLGVVVGYAELLLNSVDESSPIRPRLMNIMQGGERAAAIVQDLLTLARRGVPSREILNLNKIIVDSQYSPEFENLSSYHSSVRITTDLEPDLLNISGSFVHLAKTLFNLVSNAVEAMQGGGIVTIKTTNRYLDKPIREYDEVREGDYVVLSVSDTGEGIPAADLKRIFEPFYTKKVMGRSGTGLGLAVVWGTVKDHHGYINVESEEGKGSVFTLYFPVTREDISSEAVAVAVSEYMGNGESILVVDDVKGQRDLAAEMLQTLNYSVTTVSSGEEAVAYVMEHHADLIVLDMIMDPGMDGLNTYKKVLEIHPKQKAIIVSGFSETYRVNVAQTLGAGAYLRKPYIIEKLGLAVKKELDRK